MVPVLSNFSGGGVGWGRLQDQTALSQSISNAAAGQENSFFAAQHARFLADWRGLNEDLSTEPLDPDIVQTPQLLSNGHNWVTQVPEVSHGGQGQALTALLDPSSQPARISSVYSIDSDESLLDLSDGRQGPREDFNAPGFQKVSSHSIEGSLSATNAESSEYSVTKENQENKSSRLRSYKSISHTSDPSGRRALLKSATSSGKIEDLKITLPSKDMSMEAQHTRKASQETPIQGASKGFGSARAQNSDDPDSSDGRSRATRKENGQESVPPSILRSRQVDAYLDASSKLPAEKGFPIQIGSELFRLSGASIRSDGQYMGLRNYYGFSTESSRAPSYFTRFFEEQMRQNDENTGVRTLYIDRDPATFQDICRHLQGYHIQPRDASHYVRLFADAQFYSLPRLISQLFESEIFINIGGENFQIPKDIFSADGDKPNYFTLGFGAYFASPKDVFPGLDRTGLFRPPSILPPSVQKCSARVFSELLHLLRGYPLHIRDNDHRAELLRDARYFHLKGLEQKLISHEISFNIERQRSEILLHLKDVKPSGVSFVGEFSPSERSPLAGWVHYNRPFVDEQSYELIIEISDESTQIDLRIMRATFYGDVKARITRLFEVVANKMNLPNTAPLGVYLSSGGIGAQPVSPGNTPLSEDKVKIRVDRSAHIKLDGEEYQLDDSIFDEYREDVAYGAGTAASHPMSASHSSTPSWTFQEHKVGQDMSRPSSTKPPPRKRKRGGSMDEFGEWIIRKGQWRLRVQPRMEHPPNQQAMEIVLYAVKLDAVSGQRGRNMLRGFLS